MIKELIQHTTQGDGVWSFTAIISYRNKSYAIAFQCYPEYEKDHMRLYPDNLRFLEKNAKPTDLCISEVKRAIRNHKKFYKS